MKKIDSIHVTHMNNGAHFTFMEDNNFHKD